MKQICVFCGSNSGVNRAFGEVAGEVGEFFAKRGITLIYGGGRIGLMGMIADSVLANGGKVIGVIPSSLAEKEVAHQGLTELHVVRSMHERKAMMAELSDGFIAMPGGFGTFEEFCEIITWAQLGFHPKPCGLLNVEGFYDHLIALFDHAAAESFIKPAHRGLVLVGSEIAGLFESMRDFRPPSVEQLIDLESA